jgi:hypothetical protein
MRAHLAILLVITIHGAAGATPHDDARTTLRTHCGSCHDSAQASAKPAALAIFDLASSGWADGLSDVRLDKVLARMEKVGDPGGVEKIKAFVAAERAARTRIR